MQRLLLLLALLGSQVGAESSGWKPSLWLEAIRVIGALLLIVPLIYLAVRFWGKQTQGSGGKIEVLERAPLAQGKTLYLVKVGAEVFFLGGAERSLTLLAKYEQDAAQALIQGIDPPEPPEFQQILAGQIQQLKKLRKSLGREKEQRD